MKAADIEPARKDAADREHAEEAEQGRKLFGLLPALLGDQGPVTAGEGAAGHVLGSGDVPALTVKSAALRRARLGTPVRSIITPLMPLE